MQLHFVIDKLKLKIESSFWNTQLIRHIIHNVKEKFNDLLNKGMGIFHRLAYGF